MCPRQDILMQATYTSPQRRKKSRREFTVDTPRDVLIDNLIDKEYKIRRMQGLFADALQLLQETERRTAEAKTRILETAEGLERWKQRRVNLPNDNRNMKSDTVEARWWASHDQEELAEKTSLLSHLSDETEQAVGEAACAHLIREQHEEALATARGMDNLWRPHATMQSEAQQTDIVAVPVCALSSPVEQRVSHVISGNIRSRPPSTSTTPSTYSECSQETPHSILTDIRPRANHPYRMRRAHSVSGATRPPDPIRDNLCHVENSRATPQPSNTALKSLLFESQALPSEIIYSSSQKRRLSLTERMLDIGKAIFCPSSAVAGVPADPWHPTEHRLTACLKPKLSRRYSVDSDKSLPPPVPPKDYPSTRKERLLLADDLRYGAAAKEMSHYREAIIANKERDTSAYLGPDKAHREAAAMLAYPDRRDLSSPCTSFLSTTPATPTVPDENSRRSSRIMSSTLVAISISSDGDPNTTSPALRFGLAPQTVPAIMVTPPSRTTSIEDLPLSLTSKRQGARLNSGVSPPMGCSPGIRAPNSPKHLIGGPPNPPASLLLSPERCRAPRARKSNSRVRHRQKDMENRSSQPTDAPLRGQVSGPASTSKRIPVNRGHKVEKSKTRPPDLPLLNPPPIEVSFATARPSRYEGTSNNPGSVPAPKQPSVNNSPRIVQDTDITLSSDIKTLRRVKRRVLRV